jgi:hypothetical protein
MQTDEPKFCHPREQVLFVFEVSVGCARAHARSASRFRHSKVNAAALFDQLSGREYQSIF